MRSLGCCGCGGLGRVLSLYMCVCYLPHQASTYYGTAEDVDRLAHWDKLSADMSEFSASGSIVLLGDTNSRTARLHDIDTRLRLLGLWSSMWEWLCQLVSWA